MNQFRSFTAPEISSQDIKNYAIKFRSTYWKNKPSPLPIIDIAEFDLNIEVRPVPQLEYTTTTTCYITSDFNIIMIDEGQYCDERYDHRTNFSIAHEIGHLVLHENIYKDLSINSKGDIYQFIYDCPETEYYKLERQANIFAGNVLVPRDELVDQIKLISDQGEMQRAPILLQRHFKVSQETIIIRMRNEKITLDEIEEL